MSPMLRTRAGSACAVLTVLLLAPLPLAGQTQADALHQPFDQILDLNVRDGYVYYHALKQSRAALDRYIASLDVPPAVYESWTRDERLAFWLNAYDAFVLQTVIDRYPIRGRAKEYPPDSVRQIYGAFDRRLFRAAGRRVTLDEIEKKILPEFKDPRVYFALGMGAVSSGRLRSETYSGARLGAQLDAASKEFLTTHIHVAIDRVQNEVAISAVIGWHESEFAAAHADADPRFATRSPIERAVVAMLRPHLFPSEQAFLERNDFRVRYLPFDWRLNDLTGGRR
jgi:hypothetical protein